MSVDLKLLSSAHNDTIKQLTRLLQQGRERRKQECMVLEGIHLCQSCLQLGGEFLQVFINQQAEQKTEVQALLAALPDSVPGYLLDQGLCTRVSALASAPEVLAVCRRPLPAPAPGDATRLLLEDIQDPGNLGTILRSAAASGVRQIYLSPSCVDVYAPKVLRSAMGAHFALAIHEQADLAAVLQTFSGIRLVTSLSGERSLYRQDLRAPVAFVFGNEGAGVSAELQALADVNVKIPMPGDAESLNVAMAATLCLFERVRQLEMPAA